MNRCICLAPLLGLILGCGTPKPPAVTTPPAVPLKLARPLPTVPGPELAKMSIEELSAYARAAMREQNYESAALAQRLAVDRGFSGQYNLACFESRLGRAESAFYWLQEAAVKEGVDSEWAQEDPDLQLLRNDRRWSKVSSFLSKYQRYWENTAVEDHCLILPTGHSGGPLPVMVWLHGFGDRAESYLFPESQQLADDLQIAFLSVSGTRPLGPTKFAWDGDPDRNQKRVDEAFAKFADRLKPEQGKVALGGFSQGGMVAGEFAARDPNRYSGAMIMSPGGFEVSVGSLKLAPQHRNQFIVCLCGGAEHPSTVANTREYAQWYRSAGAEVTEPAYPGMSDHAIVPDFSRQLPVWLPKLLDVSAPSRIAK